METPISSNTVYKDILDRIINLELEPGSKISENQISAEYNVSRSVIRNAFARLAQINFLKVYPQRGTYVNHINIDYIKTALIIRMAIEKEMLYRFMKAGDKDDTILKMEENMRQQEKFYYEKEYIDDFKALDEQFHEFIMLSCERGNVLDLIGEHLLHINRWRNVYIKSGVKISHLIDQHKKILEYIKLNDIDNAMKHMSEHIDTVHDILGVNEKYLHYFSK